jgi:hypothetical protein
MSLGRNHLAGMLLVMIRNGTNHIVARHRVTGDLQMQEQLLIIAAVSLRSR